MQGLGGSLASPPKQYGVPKVPENRVCPPGQLQIQRRTIGNVPSHVGCAVHTFPNSRKKRPSR